MNRTSGLAAMMLHYFAREAEVSEANSGVRRINVPSILPVLEAGDSSHQFAYQTLFIVIFRVVPSGTKNFVKRVVQ